MLDVIEGAVTGDEHCAPYLGLRHIPPELNEFELNTYFTFSSKERGLIDARRNDLYRLALALHLGFVRWTGRTLDAYKGSSQKTENNAR